MHINYEQITTADACPATVSELLNFSTMTIKGNGQLRCNNNNNKNSDGTNALGKRSL